MSNVQLPLRLPTLAPRRAAVAATPLAEAVERLAPGLVRRPPPAPSPLASTGSLATMAFGAALASAAACVAGLGLGPVLAAAGAGVAIAALGVLVYGSLKG